MRSTAASDWTQSIEMIPRRGAVLLCISYTVGLRGVHDDNRRTGTKESRGSNMTLYADAILGKQASGIEYACFLVVVGGRWG